MDVGTLEQWLWDAECEIRGPLDAPKFKDYILPLVFLKRLSDVFDDEITRLAEEFGGEGKALAVADTDHSVIPSGIYVPEAARWSTVSKKTTGLGEHLTTAVRAVARENLADNGPIARSDLERLGGRAEPRRGIELSLGHQMIESLRPWRGTRRIALDSPW